MADGSSTVAGGGAVAELRLTDIGAREVVELTRMDLPMDEMEPLLERGVLPGCRICPLRSSPFGDPIIEVEGMVLALRKEMASCLCVRRAGVGDD